MIDIARRFALGDKPEPYDWRNDPRARPMPGERNEYTAQHVDQCTIRQIEIKSMFAQVRIDRYRDRQLLLAIIAILLATNMSGVREVLAAFLP